MQHAPRQTQGAPLQLELLECRTVLSTFGTRLGWSIAVADVASDNPGLEYVVGTGPGTRGEVQIYSATDGSFLGSFIPFGPNYRGGVYVATGNFPADPAGTHDVVVSTAPGTVGRVKVYRLTDGGPQQIASFMPFGPAYTGGVQIAAGNVTGGPEHELIVGRERGISTVRVYGYDTATSSFFLSRQFNAYGTVPCGVTLAAANIHTTKNSKTDPYDYNYAEIVTGRASGLPQVRIFDAQTPTVQLRASYMAYDTSNAFFRRGIDVAAGSTDGQRGAEIYVALRNTRIIRAFRGQSGAIITTFTLPASYAQSVNIAVANLDDDANDVYNVSNLYVVAADTVRYQRPLIYPGKTGSPAGLNSYRFAP